MHTHTHAHVCVCENTQPICSYVSHSSYRVLGMGRWACWETYLGKTEICWGSVVMSMIKMTGWLCDLQSQALSPTSMWTARHRDVLVLKMLRTYQQNEEAVCALWLLGWHGLWKEGARPLGRGPGQEALLCGDERLLSSGGLIGRGSNSLMMNF